MNPVYYIGKNTIDILIKCTYDTPMSISDEKKSLRTRIKKLRNDLELTEYRTWSNAISESLFSLKEFRRAERIHCYISSLNNEVDTLGIIYFLLDAGKTVTVPRCVHEKRLLKNIRIRSLDELKPSRYGLMEPDDIPENIIEPRALDLVIAPLIAFDRNGNRLGMGGGFYDSFLNSCHCPKIGLAYSIQEAPEIPVEDHDAKLDIIITDKEVIRFSHG